MNTKNTLRLSLLVVAVLGLLFLSVQPGGAAGEGRPLAALGWVGNMWPTGGLTSTITVGSSFDVYVQVYKAGVTEPAGQGVNITCTLHWAPVPYFGGTWGTATDTPMTYNTDIGNNDEYKGTITPSVGLHEFTVYCTDTTDSTEYWQGAGNGKLVVDAASGTCNGASQSNNEVYWNGLLHDSFSTDYRNPTGPVTTGATVTLRFRTCMDDLSSVPAVRLWNDRTNTETIADLTFDGHASDATLGGVTFWKYDLAVGADTNIFYYVFKATDGTATAFYRDDDPKFYGGGYGAAESNQTTAYNNSYQLTVYDSAFTVPEWFQRGVVYQIFPDRFRDGDPSNDPAAGRFFYDQSGGTVVRSGGTDWNTAVCDPRSAACPGVYSQNFYGGDLAGITGKINAGYFDQLGVSVLYLNPIFRSPSNHKYDTADYLTIDPDFGSLSDFQALAAAAEAHNIKLVLDGVFNHTSSDSTYFDMYSRYDSSGALTSPGGIGADDNSGACEAGASPYYGWYYFPAGSNPSPDQCANGAGDALQTYEAWYGYSSLPKLQANSAAVRNLIWDNGSSSVGPYWIGQGASGWRFDVGGDVDPGLANDPSNDYWEGFRSATRAVDASSITLGEEWGDASAWLLGSEWDSVMNYRYRSAVLSWLFTGCSGDGCAGGTVFEDNDSNSGSSSGSIAYISPSQFNARLRSIQEDYPPAAWKAMMNLGGSHDTNRLRFLLKKINNDNDPAAVQRMKELWLFAFTYAGAPTLYYGDEMGLSQDGVFSGGKYEDDPYNRAPFPWDDTPGDFSADTALQDFVRQMSSIRNSYRALQDGDAQHGLVIDDANKIYGFARTNASQTAIILLNRDGVSHSVTLNGLDAAPYNLTNGTVLLNVIDGGTYTVTSGAVTVSVNPTWGVVLLEQDKIETPAAPASPAAQFDASGVTLAWDLVSMDTGGGREVPTSYTVHRSAASPFTPDESNRIATVNPPAYGAADARLSYTDNTASGTEAYAVCAVNAGGKSSCVFAATQCAADTSLYRSASSGSWTDNAAWEVSSNGGLDWSAAGCWPVSGNGAIQVQGGHTLTLDANLTVDQATIDAGGQVTLGSGVIFTVADGAGTDLAVSGTLLNQGTLSISDPASWAVAAGGTYIHNTLSSVATPLNHATLDAASNFIYRGSTALNPPLSLAGRTYGNLSFESASGLWSRTPTGSTALTVQGDLSIGAAGAGTVSLNPGGSYTGQILIAQDFQIGPGSMLTVTTNAVEVGGNWDNSGTFTPGTSTVTFNGSSTQTLGGSSSTTFNNLTLDNAGGVSLAAGQTVNGVLTFTDGKLVTGANTLILGSGGSVSGAGAGKYVHGNLQKAFGSGTSQAFKFEIGDASNYTPAELANFNVTVAGTLTASTTPSRHPEFISADIGDKYVSRYWTLTPAGGLATGNYDITLTFVPGDLVGSPDTNNLIVQKYSPSTWSNPASSSSTAATVTGTGFTSFSDFFAGEGGVPTPVTVSYFRAERSGRSVTFDWSTMTESGNVGFNLYTETDGERLQLNDELIPSTVTDSLDRQNYSFSAETDGESFYIEDVSVLGGTRLHGPFAQGRDYGDRLDSGKIDWAAVRSGSRYANPDLAVTPGDPTRLALKVDRTGLYRVGYEALRRAGLDLAGVRTDRIRLSSRGKVVPIRFIGKGVFGPGSSIEFYGEALDTLYTDTNVYTLQVSREGSPAVAVDTTAPSKKIRPPLAYSETLVVDNPKAYANYAPGEDAWYDTSMLAYTTPKSWDFDFEVDGLADPNASAGLELVVWGVTDWPQTPDHHLRVSLNGVALADELFDGLVEQSLSLSLPAGTLREGSNTLTLSLPGDTGVQWDMVNLDRFSLTYRRVFAARDGKLTFTAKARAFKVTDLPGRNVVVYRLGADGPVRLAKVAVRAEGGAYSATFIGTGKLDTYLVTVVGRMNAPRLEAVPVREADLKSPARFLVIAHPDFIPGLEPLVQARRSEGLSVRVVDVNDLYARYSYGIFDPQAIKDYIAYAHANLGTEYVLLVGGDTYDYHDYLGRGSISFIPSLYATTGDIAKFVPADPLYADVDGDNLPDLAIGRFPVRTAAELDLMVQKTLDYGSKDYGRTAVFASDQHDGVVSFKKISQRLAAGMPDGWTVESLHLDDLGVATARTELLDAMNRGTALVTFTGHSSPVAWTFSGLFNTGHASGLTNAGRPFVAVQWGCWNTYYVDPVNNYLVQSLLFSGDRGAAAVLGASTLTGSDSEALLGGLLTPRLAAPGMSLGQALQEAKSELAQSHPDLLDVLLGWTLMGDPTLVIDP
ncbi:MAG: C25 family cysteine peptidase [Chloroflexota bacterium]